MPIYEYRCDRGHRFEFLQVRPDEAVECPECRSTALTREFSDFAVGASAPKHAPVPSCGQRACEQYGCQAYRN